MNIWHTLRTILININEKSIDDIKQDIVSLRKILTTKTKFFVVTRVSNILAKITKLGITFMKDFASEAKREIIKRSVKGLIDFAIEKGNELLL